jgi:DNA-binding LacI/PurR family transcriptional regulator
MPDEPLDGSSGRGADGTDPAEPGGEPASAPGQGTSSGRAAPEPGTVTLADVARLAGTSPATVTRALHGHPRVLPSTRARVEGAAVSLGYVPHLGARALAKRSTETIGLLMPTTADGFWGEVAAGLEQRAMSRGYSTLIATSHNDARREFGMLELFLGKRVDGIVVGSAAAMPTAWFPASRPSTPIVLLSWNTPYDASLDELVQREPTAAAVQRVMSGANDTPYRHIATDDATGTADAVKHLLELGHRSIAFAGLAPIRPSLLRFLGLRTVLEEHGLEPAAAVECPLTLEGGQRAGREIAAMRPRPTAIVAYDDMVAVGIIRAVHAAGLRVPEDISVAGFDDVEVAALIEPPLTTVRQAMPELGSVAVDTIFSLLEGTAVEQGPLLRAELVVRESTGPANVG